MNNRIYTLITLTIIHSKLYSVMYSVFYSVKTVFPTHGGQWHNKRWYMEILRPFIAYGRRW